MAVGGALSRRQKAGVLLAALVAVFFSPCRTEAQEADAAALAQSAQNPLASVISVPIQWNSNFGMGLEDRTRNVIQLQPVLLFSLGSGLTLITLQVQWKLLFASEPAHSVTLRSLG